jgi:hypothetical protein
MLKKTEIFGILRVKICRKPLIILMEPCRFHDSVPLVSKRIKTLLLSLGPTPRLIPSHIYLIGFIAH